MRNLFLIGVVALVACRDTPDAYPTPNVNALQAGPTVVDSALPVDEEIRRFRATMPGPPRTELRDGADSRDTLVGQFLKAVAMRDEETLRSLLIDRAEFIDIYYPASIYTKPPYRQGPAFVWFQFQEHSRKGLTRLLDRYGGVALGVAGYECDPRPALQGQSKLWQRCRVEWRKDHSTIQLFGTILEHAGRFKFVSFANDL